MRREKEEEEDWERGSNQPPFGFEGRLELYVSKVKPTLLCFTGVGGWGGRGEEGG